MDSIFIATLLFIFVTALVGTYIQRRSRDLCLKDFTGFNVTVEMNDGKCVWGRLNVFFNSIELFYPTPHQDSTGHIETSFILYQSDLARLRAIYRYHDELSKENQRRRIREIKRAAPPKFWRLVRRGLRSFLNTFRDALTQSFGVIAAKTKRSVESPVLQSQDARLTQMGQTVLGAVPNAYEPILERYIGHRVVAEALQGETSVEYEGILKEYSSQWIEILDSSLRQEERFSFEEVERLRVNRNLDFLLHFRRVDEFKISSTIRVQNHGSCPVHVKQLEAEGYIHQVDQLLSPGGSIEINVDDLPSKLFSASFLSKLPYGASLKAAERCEEKENSTTIKLPLPKLWLTMETERKVDICLPRPLVAVRHGGQDTG